MPSTCVFMIYEVQMTIHNIKYIIHVQQKKLLYMYIYGVHSMNLWLQCGSLWSRPAWPHSILLPHPPPLHTHTNTHTHQGQMQGSFSSNKSSYMYMSSNALLQRASCACTCVHVCTHFKYVDPHFRVILQHPNLS